MTRSKSKDFFSLLTVTGSRRGARRKPNLLPVNCGIQANTEKTSQHGTNTARIRFFGFINFIFGTVVIPALSRTKSQVVLLTSRDITCCFLRDLPPRRKNGQERLPAFQNPWRSECSRGAQRRAWKRLKRCWTFPVIASTCDNLVWLPSACRFHCAPVRAQLLPSSARLTPCAPAPSLKAGS